VIVEDGDGTSVGFALVAINGEVAEIELNGIDSDFQGKGAYTALLSWVMYTVANRGVKSLSISTQVQNNRVIRAWIRAGFNFDFALNTFHVMPSKK
jgi:GNAT superfamily N-acetyltransferase